MATSTRIVLTREKCRNRQERCGRGLVDEAAAVRENLLAMRRVGSDLIITYHGRDALQKGWLE